MSGFGVQPDDMTRTSVIDWKLDALLAGREPAAGDELAAELSLMLEQLDQAFPAVVVVSEQLEDNHLTRMMEAAAEVPAPATALLAPARHGLLARTRDGLSRKVAAATLALTTAFGGAAYAGVLPARLQALVADAAAAIGLQLPRPGDDAADDRAATARDRTRGDHDGIEIAEGRADDDHRRPADAAGYAPGAGGDDQRAGAASDDGGGGGGGANDDRDRDDADDLDDDEGRRMPDDDDEPDDDEADEPDEPDDDEADDDEADDDEAELGDHDDESDDDLEESDDGERSRAYEDEDDEADERVGGSSGDQSDSDDRDLEEDD